MGSNFVSVKESASSPAPPWEPDFSLSSTSTGKNHAYNSQPQEPCRILAAASQRLESFGQSQRVLCDTHGLSYANFGYWSRKLRADGAKRQQALRSGFVPVTLQPSSGASGLRLALPNGIEIHGIAHSDLALIGQLVELLS